MWRIRQNWFARMIFWILLLSVGLQGILGLCCFRTVVNDNTVQVQVQFSPKSSLKSGVLVGFPADTRISGIPDLDPSSNVYTCISNDLQTLTWTFQGTFQPSMNLSVTDLGHHACIQPLQMCNAEVQPQPVDTSDHLVHLGPFGSYRREVFYPALVAILLVLAGIGFVVWQRTRRRPSKEEEMVSSGNKAGWFGERQDPDRRRVVQDKRQRDYGV